MHFQIHNLTSESIACIHDQQRGEKPLVLPAQARRETDSALFGRSKLLLAPYDESGDLSTMNWGIDPETFVLHMSMALSASWQPLRVAESCPWRVYCSKVCARSLCRVTANGSMLGFEQAEAYTHIPAS